MFCLGFDVVDWYLLYLDIEELFLIILKIVFLVLNIYIFIFDCYWFFGFINLILLFNLYKWFMLNWYLENLILVMYININFIRKKRVIVKLVRFLFYVLYYFI